MHEHVLLVLPTIITLSTAVVALLALQADRFQRILSVCSMGLLLAAALLLLRRVDRAGILVTQIGDWPAPFGITLVADHLSAILLVIVGIVGVSGSIYALGDIDAERVRHGFYPLLHVLTAGVCGVFLTGDIFNLYVWFEVMLIASFILTALGNTRPQLEGAVKYAFLSLVASSFVLSGVGLLYGLTGTLNMADLAVQLGKIQDPHIIIAVSMLLMIGFGLKAAVFPFFFWLPPAYPTPPVTITAVFVGLLTKVGVYALIRLFTLLFTQDVVFTHSILLWIAGLTMVTGVLGAAVRNEFRRILSFHHVSQIGYLVMGLALFTPLALAGSIFFLVHYVIVKTNLFYISGLANRLGGSFELKTLGGFYQEYPLLSILFLIPALSLAGFPPLSGFWAKFILAKAGFEISQYFIVAVALLVGFLTLFSMTKIWKKAFLAPKPESSNDAPKGAPPAAFGPIYILFVPAVLLTLLTLGLSLYAAPLYDLAAQAAEELMHPDRYIHAVLDL